MLLLSNYLVLLYSWSQVTQNMRRGQMPAALVGETGKEELHGASLVHAINTDQQDLPFSYPNLLHAKSQHWLQLDLDQGFTFSWADNVPSISTQQATWERMWRAPRKSTRYKADCFRYQHFLYGSNIMDITAVWTSFCFHLVRLVHSKPTHASARALKLQIRDEQKKQLSLPFQVLPGSVYVQAILMCSLESVPSIPE